MYSRTCNQLKQVIIIITIAILLAGSNISAAANNNIDTTPPFIQLEHIYNAAAKKPLSIKAVVGDSGGVKTVNLFYRSAGSKVYKVLQMKKGVDNFYMIKIPEISYPGLEFYIEATDIFNNKSTEGLASGPYLISVRKNNICGKKWLCVAVVGTLATAAFMILNEPDSASASTSPETETGSATIKW